MPNITKAIVQRAAFPARGQTFIRDTSIQGFALRLTAKGAKSFVWEGRIKGRPRLITIGQFRTFRSPRRERAPHKIRAAMIEGRDPSEEHQTERREPIFADLIKAYFERHANKHKRERSIGHDQWCVSKYVPQSWRGRRLSDIRRDEVENLHATIGNKHGHYAANHTIRFLRCLFNLAREWKMLSGENPSARIRLFKEERRERFLSPEELRRVNQALLDEPDWRWRAFFRVALMLGTRRSELLSVRWADIDLKQRTLRLPETKAGRPHFLPLPEPACNALSIPAELRQVRMGVPIQPQERAYRRTREGLATHSRAGRR